MPNCASCMFAVHLFPIYRKLIYNLCISKDRRCERNDFDLFHTIPFWASRIIFFSFHSPIVCLDGNHQLHMLLKSISIGPTGASHLHVLWCVNEFTLTHTTRYHIKRTKINTLVAHWMFCFAISPGKFQNNSRLCHGSVRKKPKHVMICFWFNRFHVSCTCTAMHWSGTRSVYCCHFCICVCGHRLILRAIKRDHKIVNDLHSIIALYGPEFVSFVWSLIDMCVFVGGWVYSAFINSVNDRNTRIQNETRIVRILSFGWIAHRKQKHHVEQVNTIYICVSFIWKFHRNKVETKNENMQNGIAKNRNSQTHKTMAYQMGHSFITIKFTWFFVALCLSCQSPLLFWSQSWNMLNDSSLKPTERALSNVCGSGRH